MVVGSLFCPRTVTAFPPNTTQLQGRHCTDYTDSFIPQTQFITLGTQTVIIVSEVRSGGQSSVTDSLLLQTVIGDIQ